MDREALPQLDWIGMNNDSYSLGMPPAPFFSVRMKPLSHIGLKIPANYYGGTLTWGELGGLGIPWGNNEVVHWDGLQPGYIYKWEIPSLMFTVFNELGAVISSQKVTTVSDLGITWDILESPQFWIRVTGDYQKYPFLVAWYLKKGVPTDPEEPEDPEDPHPPHDPTKYMTRGIMQEIKWSFVDKYLGDVMHVSFDRLIDRMEHVVVDFSLSSYVSLYKSIVSARIAELSASGNFPNNLLMRDINSPATKQLIDRNSEAFALNSLVMISLFASIGNASKPVYEPWMLWKLWQWYGKGSVVLTRERIFDLSPWWG